MLIVGGANSSGIARTCSVCGAYWISSKTSVRRTTVPGREREVLADRELARVDGRGQAREVADEVARAAHQVRAALIDAGLDDRRVRPREVRRRERVEHVAGREAGLALGAPVRAAVGDQPVDGLLDGEVRLQQPPEQPARLPRRIGEAAIALAGAQVGAPAGDAGQLRPQVPGAAGRAVRSPREPGADLHGGARAQEPRAAVGGVGEQDVEGRVGGLRDLGHADHALLVACQNVTIPRRRRAVIRCRSRLLARGL